jgi:hypothetical protein
MGLGPISTGGFECARGDAYFTVVDQSDDRVNGTNRHGEF